jgi:uncharacterized membrane protein HdeD (DUF308 family)
MATSSIPAPAPPSGRIGAPWWIALMDGIALTTVGALLVVAPSLAVFALIRFLGIYWLVDGILKIVSVFLDRSGWPWKVAGGLLGIVAGLAVIEHPLASALLVPAVIVLSVGMTGIVLGAIELVMAFRGAGWATGILGAVNIVVGLLVLLNPLTAAPAFAFVIGALALAGGMTTIIFALTMPLLVRPGRA